MTSAVSIAAAVIASIAAIVSTIAAGRMARSLERLKAELGHGAAQHEATLRVRGEIRLRLFERAVRAVERAVVFAHNEAETVGVLAYAAHTGEKQNPVGTGGGLARTGVLLPPELDDAYRALRNELDAALFVVVRKMNGDAVSVDELRRADDSAKTAVEAFEAAARAWKRKHWNDLIGAKLQVTLEPTTLSARATVTDGGDKS